MIRVIKGGPILAVKINVMSAEWLGNEIVRRKARRAEVVQRNR